MIGPALRLRVFDRLARRDPERVDRFLAVVRRDLIGRRGDQVEMRVEALGHEGGRDPVRERHHRVERDVEIVGLGDPAECRRAREQIAAVAGLERAHPRFGQKLRFAPTAGEQHAALLEGFAHRGDAHREVLVVEVCATGAARAQRRIAVGGIDLAAREHQRALREVDLVVALHHEDLETAAIVAQQQYGGGGDGRLRFVCHGWGMMAQGVMR